ncbi:MAG TPA: hypothetical protein PKE14_06160 [Chitinophagales bacterium]|nr:hypothetical protein [Chitinophagales bacterium]
MHDYKMKMNSSILMLCVILLSACTSNHVSEPRFQFSQIDIVSYKWTSDTIQHDWQLYIASIGSIDSLGQCAIARRDTFKGTERYFKQVLPMAFDSLIAKINFKELPTSFFTKDDVVRIYDGFTYCLLWHQQDTIVSTVFEPDKIPHGALRDFIMQLNDFIQQADTESSTSFDYSEINRYILEHVVDSSRLPPYRDVIEFKRTDSPK